MFRQLFYRIRITVVATVIGLAFSGSLTAVGVQDPDFLALKRVQEAHTNNLLAIRGVVGTAIGLDEHNRLAIKVFVTSANVHGVPTELEGKRVQRVVTGPISALEPKRVNAKRKVDATTRFTRPVPIGVSTGHPQITAGTISCRVTDGENVYALSNNHVYAKENSALLGDPILQPGAFDGGNILNDVIGSLASFEKITFSRSASNVIDAAIALSTKEMLGNATPSNGYGVPKKATIQPELDMSVKKYGRTTGLTKGKIMAMNATVDVQYSSGVARFVNQIIIFPGSFSSPGDSGSLVVANGKGKSSSNNRRPVGLLFAGSPTITVANPIDEVLNAFGVSIDGQ